TRGVDPMAVKREKKIRAAAEAHTFKNIAEEFVDKLRKEGRAETTLSKIEWLLALAYPDIGSRRVSELKPA
ncbi:MAG TPA: integrase, partial [Parvularcula sp.]|nr:integrase [Parvularcula sp.]